MIDREILQTKDGWLNPHISIGDILQIAVMIAAIAAAWANLNGRLVSNEAQTAANTATVRALADGQIKQNRALDILVQRLEDYPLHIHTKTDGIIYPRVFKQENP